MIELKDCKPVNICIAGGNITIHPDRSISISPDAKLSVMAESFFKYLQDRMRFDSPWISVKDRFPEKDQKVLGFLKSCKYDDLGGWCTVMYLDYMWTVYDICKDDYFEITHQDRVICWMPLPPPPEAKDE